MSTIQQSQTASQPIDKIVSTLGQYNLLPQLQREIVLEEAIESVECSLEEIETAYRQMLEAANNNRELQAYNMLQQNAASKKQILSLVRRRLKIDKFKQANWSAEVPSYFISCKKKLDKLVYSRIAHQDEGVATEIYFRIKGREQTFTELAREYSQAKEANLYEIYNPIKTCNLESSLASFLTDKKVGEVLPPIFCHNIYLVIRLEQIVPAVLDEAMHQKLLDELFEKWLEQQCEKPQYRQLMLQKLSSWSALN